MPKRPTTAYLYFCEQEKPNLRREFEKEYPELPATEFTKLLVDTWKKLDPAVKAPFLKKHEQDKERFARELLAYNEKRLLRNSEENGHDSVDGGEGAGDDDDDENDDHMGDADDHLKTAASGSYVAPNYNFAPVDLRPVVSAAQIDPGLAQSTREDDLPSVREEEATEMPPAKKAKTETTTHSVAQGANGQPRFTIKIRSPTAPTQQQGAKTE